MAMEIKKSEAIELVLGFYTGTCGYWTDYDYKSPVLDKFVESDLTIIDEKGKCIPNDKGNDVLRHHVNDIISDLIMYFINHQFSCEKKDLAKWFVKEYELNDIEIAYDIIHYIAQYLNQNELYYGYNLSIPHSARPQGNCILNKIGL